jgi:hypothetical protein
MLRERTKAGLEAARENGRISGRQPKVSPQQQAGIARMVSTGEKAAVDAARLFKIHPPRDSFIYLAAMKRRAAVSPLAHVAIAPAIRAHTAQPVGGPVERSAPAQR